MRSSIAIGGFRFIAVLSGSAHWCLLVEQLLNDPSALPAPRIEAARDQPATAARSCPNVRPE